jgi:hypothetical protein
MVLVNVGSSVMDWTAVPQDRLVEGSCEDVMNSRVP